VLHELMESIEERLRLLFVPKQLHIRCALVGPAQCGKSTVVAELTKEEVGSVYRYTCVAFFTLLWLLGLLKG
jgi:GTPase SAR1 family protein